MWEERNTGSNLPAQIELYAARGAEYRFLLMAKGGGSANKSFLYQQTKAVLNEASMIAFLTEKITKRHGRQLICSNEACNYVRSEELATASAEA